MGCSAPTSSAKREEEVERFEFQDGTVWTRADIEAAVLAGTPGDDTITGFYAHDWIDGGAGNDLMNGVDGGDTYVFGVGYGHDIIDDWPRWVWDRSPDRVLFNDTVAPEDVTFSLSGNSVVVTLTSGDTLTVRNPGPPGARPQLDRELPVCRRHGPDQARRL